MHRLAGNDQSGTRPGRSEILLILAGLAIVFAACVGRPARETPGIPDSPRVRSGLEVLLEDRLDVVRGRKVGLITNPTGVDGLFRAGIDLLAQAPGVKLVALYGPEHGVRGGAQAGEHVPFHRDSSTGLPVFSLYGQSLELPSGMLKDIDAYMRSFDTQETGKVPDAEMIEDVEVLLFDVQDVGTRVYTYVATMAYAMKACAETGVEFVVLDRPNPIGGNVLEGPVLEYPEFSSFIGLYPVPQRHGMTAGELARLFNDRFLDKPVSLTVMPMDGWRRDMWFDETGLPWVIPSPNMPTPDTAAVYPGQVCWEGTSVSEGRGTTRPFELFGAPWIDGGALAARLQALNLPGVVFREAWFTPTFSKFQGRLCGGAQMHVTDRAVFRPFAASLAAVAAVRDMYPDDFEFHADYFDKVMGTAAVREALERGEAVEDIVASLEASLRDFRELRRPYLLYPETAR